jgi:hypothetical protein
MFVYFDVLTLPLVCMSFTPSVHYIVFSCVWMLCMCSVQTDIIIPSSSCHPYEHKLSGINYLINQLHTYPITEKAKDAEKNTVRNILHNNEYDKNLISKAPPQQKAKTKHTCWLGAPKAKWVTFTVVKKKIFFQDTQIKVAFWTGNTIWNILKTRPQTHKYSRNGIYKMKCLDCSLKYVGQTGRIFNIRYK